jgi:hypothetical protein
MHPDFARVQALAQQIMATARDWTDNGWPVEVDAGLAQDTLYRDLHRLLRGPVRRAAVAVNRDEREVDLIIQDLEHAARLPGWRDRQYRSDSLHRASADLEGALADLLELDPTRSLPEPASQVPAPGHHQDDKAPPTPPAPSGPRHRPCYARDHLWLRWHLEEGLGPAKIRDKWNREYREYGGRR